MELVIKTIVTFFIIEVLGIIILVVWNTLPDYKWYRKLKGGIWYLKVSKDATGITMQNWTKKQPSVERTLLIEFN
jgi:hypothetical protein